jgi:DNA helicase TIP49 (TBP-interacting protein)
MLECKLCDYYKSFSNHVCPNHDAGKCEFTGMLFFDDVENLDIEYPCYKISYMDYLNKTSEIISSARIS